jgi:hypothetical protein
MIQQIVDENGTLRHIILSALNNNGNSPSNTALMPQQQQQQQQQPFPYCCCCCYSCTGTAPTAPLPPPPPPPPPPQLHHNILAFPNQPSRRRLPNRTFSPAGKRAPPTFYNNNTLGKSPVRNKIGSTAAASVDGVSKVSYANSKHTTASDNKPYELNSNRVLVGKVNHNENCLSDTNKHVLNNTCINKESIDHSISKTIIETDGSILTQTRTAPPLPPFSYTSLEEQKDLSLTSDNKNCSHFDKSNNSSILLEINLSSDPRNQQFIEEEEEETETINEEEVPENNLLNSKIDDQIIETSRVKDSSDDNEVSLLCEESLEAEFEHDLKGVDLPEEDEQINEQNYKNSNTTTGDSQSNSCISSQMQDNQNDDNCMAEQIYDDKWTAKLKSEQSLNTSPTLSQNTSQQLNKQLIDRSDSINSDKSERIIEDTDISIQRSFDEFQKIESITNSNNNNNNSNKLGEEENEGQAFNEELGKGVKSSPQRSPKHLLPQLQLLNLTYTSLTANTVKLKWTYSQPHSLQDQLYAKHYVVEMLLNKSCTENISQNCRIVYQGHSNNCRISHLSSQQQYSFRVRTTSEEHLVVSNILTITTPEQQPISNKYNKKSKQQLLQQQIQQQQHQIHQQQILLQQQQQLQEQQSRVNESDEPAISSDQRCAILILLLFTLFALIVAVLIQHLLTD